MTALSVRAGLALNVSRGTTSSQGPTLTNAQPTVFVVDNDENVCSQITRLATSMQLGVEAYNSGEGFLKRYGVDRLGCLICEFRIWDVSGLQIQQKLSERKLLLPVIFFSQHITPALLVRATRAGAVDLIEKPSNEVDLCESIQQAVALCRARFAVARRQAESRAKLARLTSGEREVLDQLLDGCGPSNSRIAETLGLSLRTVQIRRRRLMKKFEARTIVDLLKAAQIPTPDSCLMCPRLSTESCKADCYA